MSPGIGLALVALGLAPLLLAEALGLRRLAFVAKPLASTGLLVLALEHGALETGYGVAVFTGLSLSWLGDGLLLFRGQRAFVAGLGAFLLAHLAYGVAFAAGGVIFTHVAAGVALLGAVAVPVWRWLRPNVSERLRPAVAAYVVVITAMVALAGGRLASGHTLALAGAGLFYLSDLAVARDRFVTSSFLNRAWGLPTYYAGQALLALSVSSP